MNRPSDLRTYTGESGGTHGLDDVSKGNIYLDDVFGLPHCKYHGAMLKVSPDGIWRCGITDAFQVTKVKDRSEMAISHGCYFDNKESEQDGVSVQNCIEYEFEYKFRGDASSRVLKLPAIEGTLILIPNKDIRKFPMLNMPVIVSETEKIVIDDWVQLLDSFGHSFLGGPQQWKGEGVLNNGHRKVLVLPEQFSPQILNAIADGVLTHGDKVVLECVSHIFELDPSWGGGFRIRLENNHAVFLSVKEQIKK